MRFTTQVLRFAGAIGAIVMVTGCTYYAAMQGLNPDEQAVFRAQSKVITGRQARTYLSKTSAAERAAYLKEIGSAQRFQALTAQDRETVLDGYPRKGMSAEALRFLWGEPFYTEGHTGHYEHWHYLGNSLSLADTGNAYSDAGSVVRVRLIDGQVEDWLDTVPSTSDDDGDSNRIR